MLVGTERVDAETELQRLTLDGTVEKQRTRTDPRQSGPFEKKRALASHDGLVPHPLRKRPPERP